MQPIGGYFSLELNDNWPFPHCDGNLLNTGRNALEYVLRALVNVKLLHIPYYTCDVVMEPIERLGIAYHRYHIDGQLEIAEGIKCGDGEYILYTNYFGIKDAYVRTLFRKYGHSLIIDNAQAFYTDALLCAGTIYSPRKFVGVPDGGIAYCMRRMILKEQDKSHDRCSHLLKRIELGAQAGYEDFHANSAKLHNQPLMQMSVLTQSMIRNTNFDEVRRLRWLNFKQLHEALEKSNLLRMPDFSSFACPMVYPYLTDNAGLKSHLIENKIFVATYWPNVFDWCKPEDMEYKLADRCLAIPIDQRYRMDDMEYIIDTIKQHERHNG